MNDLAMQPGPSPLYAQVREILRTRIQSGAWKPGDILPNEFQLADELNVSQGTVRKALDELATIHLVERRQGKGTFVAQHTPSNVRFRFFRLYDSSGNLIIPDSRDLKVRPAKANAQERNRLELAKTERVIRIRRVRTDNNRPVLIEDIVLPEKFFPQLQDMRELPNTLYDLFQQSYGVTIARATESLRAVSASADEAAALNVDLDAPLLEIDRIAFDIGNRPVEWRLSRCNTKLMHYYSELD